MSTNFEIFPTTNKIPKCEDVINNSIKIFNECIKNEKITYDLKIESHNNAPQNQDSKYITTYEATCTVFNLNDIGEIYVYYNRLLDIDTFFWNEEFQSNKNALKLKHKIEKNVQIGYSWIVKRTIGQPALINLFYGCIAIAIAHLTDGVIYSDDGAWDYSQLPIESHELEKLYLDVSKINDIDIICNINNWLNDLRNN